MPQIFLVERYWPGVSEGELAAALARSVDSAESMSREGRPVRHVRTTLVPADEAVLSIFEAGSAEDVAELNTRAAIPFDRIAEAVSVETEDLR
jgi:hypothetical protein